MPKFHGYREKIHTNLYDAFTPRALRRATTSAGLSTHPHRQENAKLFGSENIGDVALTNMVAPNKVASDQTFFVRGWYARTNIHPDAGRSAWRMAFDAWCHSTTMSLVVGVMPVWQRSLHDLLHMRAYDRALTDEVGDELASKLRYVYWDDADLVPWQDANEYDKARWCAVANKARDELKAAPPIIIPVRQVFGVRVDTDPCALGAYLEVAPTDIAPETLVWVHLDGVVVREVC